MTVARIFSVGRRLAPQMLRFLEASDGGNVVVGFPVSPDDHSLGVASGNPHVVQGDPYYLSLGGNDEYLLSWTIGHHPGRRYDPGLVVDPESADPLSSPGVAWIAGKGRALPVTPLAYNQQVAAGRYGAHCYHPITLQQSDAPNPAGGA